MVRVETVAPASIGEELGIVPGTDLISINGRELHDFLDWEFLSAEEQFSVLARTPAGDAVEFDIERDIEEPMGLTLEPPRIRRCGNRCDFCFVDGLPTGLRESLYVRDDDYRLSFRHGNFATLTNLKDSDMRRIVEYRLSPLYVSVHATDPIMRRRLLRNPLAPDIVEQLTVLSTSGIRFHTQIVLQPGVNDGDVLKRSLEDLWNLGETILSVSVVPVGLTEFSKHSLVREPTRDECRAVIDLVQQYGERAITERQFRWAYGSDELYLVAETDLPPADYYGDFDQVENGVGSVRFLQRKIENSPPFSATFEGKSIGVVTGTAMEHLMPLVIQYLHSRTTARFELIPVQNTLFGTRVTTAGLLPGADIKNALRTRHDLDTVIIPAETLNDEHLFIDSMTLGALCDETPATVLSSYDFVDVLGEWEGV